MPAIMEHIKKAGGSTSTEKRLTARGTLSANHPVLRPDLVTAERGARPPGWTATTTREAAARERVSLGEHGYPPERESMRAVFLARGPAFRAGVVVEPFQNIHIYPLLAHVVALKPAPNDGRLDSVRTVFAPERD
jgi:predicted AlkP superfamily pyrophosphatase or phosphodiesterase